MIPVLPVLLCLAAIPAALAAKLPPPISAPATASPQQARKAALMAIWEKRWLTQAETDELVDLDIRQAYPDASLPEFEVHRAAVKVETMAFAEELADKARGVYAPEDSDNYLLKQRAAAEDPLVRDLATRTFADQWALLAKTPGTRLSEAMRHARQPAINANVAANTRWLKAQLARIGWFDISRYGEDASRNAWLLVQHSDHDKAFQKHVLAVLQQRLTKSEVSARNVAYLTDRVAMNAGELLTYGTQGRCVGKGEWRERPTIDPPNLDARRKAVGLKPMVDYRADFSCQ